LKTEQHDDGDARAREREQAKSNLRRANIVFLNAGQIRGGGAAATVATRSLLSIMKSSVMQF
jgi:hypothetical protein